MRKVKYSSMVKKQKQTANNNDNASLLSYSFITAAVLVVALSGNRKNVHFMAYKSVEYKVLTVLSAER